MTHPILQHYERIEAEDPELAAAISHMLTGAYAALVQRRQAGDPANVSALDWRRLDRATAGAMACSLLEIFRMSINGSRATKAWKNSWATMAADLEALIVAMSGTEES